LTYLFVFAAIMYLGYSFVGKLSLQVNITSLVILVIIGALSFVANIFSVKGLLSAPNPGFSTAVVSAQILIVMLFSVLLFGSELSTIKTAGAVLVFVGAVLLGL
ncbi:MAG: EamA family transporter, partial [Candidatus Aenigmatarchaeota archaeon]